MGVGLQKVGANNFYAESSKVEERAKLTSTAVANHALLVSGEFCVGGCTPEKFSMRSGSVLKCS